MFFDFDCYYGWGKIRWYFEGWYYKVIMVDEFKVYVFIFGIVMDVDG